MIYLTSDTHFSDEGCFKYRHRPFSTVDEMNLAMVGNWNSIVSTDDTVYHLGDFATTDEAIEEFAPLLNGEIHLVVGNYEARRDRSLLLRHFSEIHEDPFVLGTDDPLWLCHYPVQRHHELYTVTGHIHSLWQVAYRMVNVGMDAWHFRPIPLDWVLEARESENLGRWDANVYPDAPLALRIRMSTKVQRDASEPTLRSLEEELKREMMGRR